MNDYCIYEVKLTRALDEDKVHKFVPANTATEALDIVKEWLSITVKGYDISTHPSYAKISVERIARHTDFLGEAEQMSY